MSILASIIAATERKRVVGRVRLQKMAYLLQAMGMEKGFFFYYHHYGPYSDDIGREITRERLGGSPSVIERREESADGLRYSVFEIHTADPGRTGEFGALSAERAEKAIKRMEKATPTVLEIAATMHWLKFAERQDDWNNELRLRKGSKVTPRRVHEAEELLAELGLPMNGSISGELAATGLPQ